MPIRSMNKATYETFKKQEGLSSLPLDEFFNLRDGKSYKVVTVGNVPTCLKARSHGVVKVSFGGGGKAADKDQKKRSDFNFQLFRSLAAAVGEEIAESAAECVGLKDKWVDLGTPLEARKIQDLIGVAKREFAEKKNTDDLATDPSTVRGSEGPQFSNILAPFGGQPAELAHCTLNSQQDYAPRSFTNFSTPTHQPHASQSQAYLNQAYPTQGYSGQGYPNQAYPNHGYPNHGYSNQAYPNQAYPNQGSPNQGYSNQGYSNQGYTNQGYPNQGYTNPASYASQTQAYPAHSVPPITTPIAGQYNTAPAHAAALGHNQLPTASAQAAPQPDRLADLKGAREHFFSLLESATHELSLAKLNIEPSSYEEASAALRSIYTRVEDGEAIPEKMDYIYPALVHLGVQSRDYAGAEKHYRRCYAALPPEQLSKFQSSLLV